METEHSLSNDTARLLRAADILKTVAHPVRLAIIDLLEDGEKTVSELCSLTGARQPYMSQQLNLMKARGVLVSRRSGNRVYYGIEDRRVVKIIHCVRGQDDASRGPEEDSSIVPAGTASESEW